MHCSTCQQKVEANWHFCRWCSTALAASNINTPTVSKQSLRDEVLQGLALLSQFSATQQKQPQRQQQSSDAFKVRMRGLAADYGLDLGL